MREVMRRDIVLLVLILTSTLQWNVSSAIFPFFRPKNNNNIQISTPEECARECSDDEEPRICYYHFTLEHYMTLSRACDNPETMSECILADGNEKSVTPINRQIPGPEILVCKNDRIVVDLVNEAVGDGIAIHWHGIFQIGTPYYDGVPQLTQCPITDGVTFRSNFLAFPSGTHMGHSHDYVDHMGGQYFSLVVRDSPKNEPHKDRYDEDIYRIVLSDMFRDTPRDHFPGKAHGNDTGQTAKNFLINGNGINVDPGVNILPGNTKITTFTVEHGKRYRFRVQNLFTTVCPTTLSVEGHKMTLISLDGEPIQPIVVDFVTSGSGERVDILVNADQTTGSYWIMLRGLGECEESKVYQLAKLVYNGSTKMISPQPTYDDIPTTGLMFNPLDVSRCENNSPDVICVHQAHNVEGKTPPELMKSKPDYLFNLIFGFAFPADKQIFANGSYERYFAAPGGGVSVSSVVNGISYMEPASPLLTQPEALNEPPIVDCPGEQCFGRQILSVPTNSIVCLMLADYAAVPGMNHPIHLHGHSFVVVEMGSNGKDNVTMSDLNQRTQEIQKRIAEGKYKSPPKKDTILLPSGGYAYICFKANNPGVWLLHCHFNWHTISGMDVVVKVGDQSEYPPVPSGFPKCGDFKPPIQEKSKYSWW